MNVSILPMKEYLTKLMKVFPKTSVLVVVVLLHTGTTLTFKTRQLPLKHKFPEILSLNEA